MGEEKRVHRITIDVPIDVYRKMSDEITYNGQTMKGFFLKLVRKYFENKETETHERNGK